MNSSFWLALGMVAACAAPPARPAPIARPLLWVAEADAPATAPPVRSDEETRPAENYFGAGPTLRAARLAYHGRLYPAAPSSPAVVPIGGESRQEALGEVVVDVVEEHPEAVRIRIDDDGVRLVAYMPFGDLKPVVRRRTRVALEKRALPDEAAGSDGAWLRPGFVAAAPSPLIQSATLDDPIYAGRAFFDPGAVDRVFERDEVVLPDQPVEGPLLAAGSRITTAAGAPVLTVRAPVAVTELASDGERRRVRYVSAELWVEGWVDAASLSVGFADVVLQGMGDCGSGGSTHMSRHLHRGDALRASPAGEVIGLVTDERVYTSFRLATALDGSAQYTVSLGCWHSLSLWLGPEDLAYGDRWEAAFTSRARFEGLPPGGLSYRAVLDWEEPMRACWRDALAAGHQGSWDLSITWQDDHITVPRPEGFPEALHACIDAALYIRPASNVAGGPIITFHLLLAPTPLPERAP